MTVLQLAHAARRGLHYDMARAVMHPVLGHTLDQVSNSPGLLVVFHRGLYEPFERARRTNPDLTFREFVLADRDAQRTLRSLLGDDQYVLATETSGLVYFAARARVLAALRSAQPPIRQWMAWGHWGSGPVRLTDEGAHRLLPVDYPVRRVRDDGTTEWAYPTVDLGRARLYQNTGYAELVRRLPVGTGIPLDGTPAAVLEALALPRDPVPRVVLGYPQMRLSTLQVVHMYATGKPALERSVIVPPGQDAPPGFLLSRGPSGRAAEDARWELAARLGDPLLVNEAGFPARIAGSHLQAAADQSRPVRGNPDHPVTTLSNAELVAVARNDHGRVEIAMRGFEVSHVRGQRSYVTMEQVMTALSPAVDTNLLAHLCGLCDPHNLRIVTQEGHAAEDFFAHFFGKRRNRYNVNTRRLPHLAGTGPSRQRPPGPWDYQLVYPQYWSTDFDEHVDFPASVNAFVSFRPYQLEPAARMLNQPAVRLAVENLGPGRALTAYNTLAGLLNAAMRSYEMSPALMPGLFVDGVWR